LASLLQVRVTELPSTISPEGLTDTEVFFGPSGGQYEPIQCFKTVFYMRRIMELGGKLSKKRNVRSLSTAFIFSKT
jgi:hypothetical protein